LARVSQAGFDAFAIRLRSSSEAARLGLEFVSLSGQVDTCTPTGKMLFNVLQGAKGLEGAE
jgi:DNA invertase Pin-like site-specific DNA recombinase